MFRRCFAVMLTLSVMQAAAGQQPARIRVDWQIEQKAQIGGGSPPYPSLAAVARVEGVVRVQFVITTSGSTDEIVALSGHPLLIPSAISAVSAWRFNPALFHNTPVEIDTIAPVFFLLANHVPVDLLADVLKEVHKHPGSAKAHEAYARQLLNLGQAAEAVEEFNLSIALDPKNRNARLGIADAIGAGGDIDGAIAAYRTAIGMDPQSADAHFGLGEWLDRKGDLDDAVAEYELAFRQHRTATQINRHFQLGLLYMKKNNPGDAIDEFKSSIRADFDFPVVHFRLGEALEATRQFDEALKEYEKAVKGSPNDPKYRAARDRLQKRP
jgi:TonB family protein